MERENSCLALKCDLTCVLIFSYLGTPLIKPETLTNNHEAVKPAKPAELNTVKHD